MTQMCGRCKEVKPSEEFKPSARGQNGHWCRPCQAAYARGEGAAVAHQPLICAHCGNEFVPKVLRPNSQYCSRACGDEGRKASGQRRDTHLLRKYGITHADYERMLEEQGGGCALCGVTAESQLAKHKTYLHVDHCHDTGRVRGLLCGEHNLLLGRFDHDPALLRRAAEYLEATG